MTPLLQDAELEVRQNATYVLGSIGGRLPSAIPILNGILKDNYLMAHSDNVKLAMAAATSLERIGPNARQSLPLLRKVVLRGKDASLRSIAWKAVRVIEEQ